LYVKDFDIPILFMIKMFTLMSEITMLILIILYDLTKQTYYIMPDISKYYYLLDILLLLFNKLVEIS